MAFTFFFRDSQTLELLVEAAVPALRGQAFIHVWDAGCACGAEPFTLAILLREQMSSFLFRNVRIHATDIDETFAAQVASGVFAEQEVKRIPGRLLERYFQPAGRPGHFQVVEEIRERVRFERHDLLSLEPIRHELSMIVCKNVLLHFEEREREEVLRMFGEALRPGGLLALEHTQKMPGPLADLFEQVAPHAQVFRKLRTAHRHAPHVGQAAPAPRRHGAHARAGP